MIGLKSIDEKGGYVYFLASPTNATQHYLYRTKLDGKGKLEKGNTGRTGRNTQLQHFTRREICDALFLEFFHQAFIGTDQPREAYGVE